MSHRPRRVSRALGITVAAGTALWLASVVRGRAVRTRPARQAVAPELRHPLLWIDFSVSDDRELARARRLADMGRNALRRAPAVGGVDVADQYVPADATSARQVRVRIHRPTGPTLPDGPRGALLWIHGGGLVLGNPEQDDPWLGRTAAKLGIVVVSVDYRLAPEHPYPAALDDCMAAARWLAEHAEELGVDPERIAVGGASAGGGLAAAVALRARDEGGPAFCFQLLNYPMLDDRTVSPPEHVGRGAFVWTPVSNRFGWSSYLGSVAGEAPEMYAAPARATALSGLPPAWIGVGELDLFHDEDIDYARRLSEAGVPCELVEEPGMYHGADLLVATAPRMVAYHRSMIDALGRALTD